MATISRFDAVAMIGKLRLSGFIAWLMWLGVHLIYLTGFKNQFTALHPLDGHVPVQRPLGAHRDRAADLRPDGAQAPAQGRHRAGQRAREFASHTADDRRAELEAQAQPRRPGSPTPVLAGAPPAEPPPVWA